MSSESATTPTVKVAGPEEVPSTNKGVSNVGESNEASTNREITSTPTATTFPIGSFIPANTSIDVDAQEVETEEANLEQVCQKRTGISRGKS